MTISSLDIKFKQSERMTGFDDGGGRMSATEIVDGVLNNVFPDLSDANTIIGNVALLKIFAQVDTANSDTLLGPFFFLTDPPVNPTVSICAFETRSATDERKTAQNYVESYRIVGVKSQYTLYGDHFVGQETVQVYCRSEIVSPDIGDVLMLSIERDGFTHEEQFVAVKHVASRQTVTYTDGQGDFQRDVLMIQITSPLQHDFAGQQDPVRIDISRTSPTLVRNSQTNDASKYYGLKRVTIAPATGDTVINVGSPYIPIVPTSQGETPVVDQLAGLAAVSYIKSSADNALTVGWYGQLPAGAADTRYFGSTYAPGTLAITVGSVQLRDDGHGGIEPVNPDDTGWSGGADYQQGSLSIARDTDWLSYVTATATAAAAVPQQSYSLSLPINANNRSISYVFQIPGQPSPGTMNIDFLALGKWTRITDQGRGRISGNPGEGSASINYATGSVAATLGALPDVDSAIIVSWGIDLRARNSSGEVTVPVPAFRQQLDHPGAAPGTLVITWVSGGIAKTASAAASGAVTGDASGNIDCTAGIVEFTTASIPDSGEQFHYAYDFVDPSKRHTEVFTPTVAGSNASFTLAYAAAENTVVARWTISSNEVGNNGIKARRAWAVVDNGIGSFTSPIMGTNTINYSSGAIVLTVE